MKVRGACAEPFWIYERLNKLRRPAPESDDVLVVEEEAFLCAGHAKEAADIYIRLRLWVSEMIRELADLGCQDTQTGDLHCIDMYLSCVGGGECKEVHV